MKRAIAIKLSVLTSLIFFSFTSILAAELSEKNFHYYGLEDQAEAMQFSHSSDFRNRLQDILEDVHQVVPGGPDLIGQCSGGSECYNHFRNSYKKARQILFGELELHHDSKGYFIKCVYCETKYYSGDFRVGPIGPGKIPNNNVLNTEHTWPQSRFGGGGSGPMKSDLHHLFSTTSSVNGIRGNDEFGEVAHATKLPCGITKKGTVGSSGQPVFEPPQSHKGNVARALFYFAVRYGKRISSQEEQFLRVWHVEDPVDEEEALRNEKVFEFQGNRNPFIDHPQWADAIQDF